MDDQQVKDIAMSVIRDHPVATVATLDEKGAPHLRPMYTMLADDDFTIYFTTSLETLKSKQIQGNSRVAVSWNTYGVDMSKWSHVLVKGEAVVSDDKELRYRLWSDMLSEYFRQGKDDPNYVVIVVKPTELWYTNDHTYPSERIEMRKIATSM